jgi:hypothetical protein
MPFRLKHNPFLPDDCLPGRVEKGLDAVITHLEQGGKLNGMTFLVHRDWKTLVEHTQVQGRQPEILEHFVALRLSLQLKSARLNLLGRWPRD